MGSIREWSWKLSLFALPWQTRWFQEAPMVGGLPWEQGRLSIYLAWIPMIVTVFFACMDFKENPDERDEVTLSDWLLFIGILLLALPAFVSSYPQASWQWVTQVILLVFFAWSLKQLKIGGKDILGWSVLSLVPHALLGVAQFVDQSVFGTKWFGIAPQDPATPGVSVVEVDGHRVLRAYGGFPHPNIFGGWLAFGLAASTLLAARATLHRRKLLAAFCILFTVALVLSFSRAAWIAAVFGVACAFLFTWRRAWTLEEKMRTFLIPCAILIAGLATLFLVRDVAFVRVDAGTRLESKSVDERTASISAACSLVPEQWWLGQGQNTAVFALDKAGKGMIPPHFIPLLILLETGLIGSLGALLLIGRWVGKSGPAGFLALSIAAPLMLLDHYLWSIWAGQCLLMYLALLPLTKDDK